MGLQVDLSPLGALIRQVGEENSIGVFWATIFPLGYLVVCQTRALFQLRLFGWWRLAGHQYSEAGPLLFNASYLIRLQFSLCYNYLLMIRGPVAEGGTTAFGLLMRNMSVIPIIGTSFNVSLLVELSSCCVNYLVSYLSRELFIS